MQAVAGRIALGLNNKVRIHKAVKPTLSSTFALPARTTMTVSTSRAPPRPTSFGTLQLPAVTPALAKDAHQAALAAASRDFRSDTVTAPTSNMGKAMQMAAGGDSVYGDDVTSNAFEASVAALFGKQAGLFVTSGTLSNQLCLRTWLMQPPYSIVCDQRAHIHQYEAGGCAFHSGAALETVAPQNGLYLTWPEIKARLVTDEDNVHYAPTRIVALENTINGVIMPHDEVLRIAQGLKADYPDVKLHLDGARIWHVAAQTGMSLEELTRPFDSISVCFSKGLGAPVGSMMLGPSTFIRKAKHFRKLFGGGMRQAGVLTAAAQNALQETFDKLSYTHTLAAWLSDQLQREGVHITLPTDTNMVWFDPSSIGVKIDDIIRAGQDLDRPFILNGSRVVIHHQTEVEAVEDLLTVIRRLKAQHI
jgi:threonine aldolase